MTRGIQAEESCRGMEMLKLEKIEPQKGTREDLGYVMGITLTDRQGSRLTVRQDRDGLGFAIETSIAGSKKPEEGRLVLRPLSARQAHISAEAE